MTPRRSLSIFALLLVMELVACVGSATAQKRDRFRNQRMRMVEEYIKREGVTNPRVLEAMQTVPRHEFLPVRLRPKAYLDGAWPIGYKQTISPPFIVAYMTQTIDPQPTDRVLEIGTGSGYQAAVLSGLVKEVYTIEIVPELGKRAARTLKQLDYDNVSTKIGDGFKGWPEHAPFDKIIVTCSPEDVPKPLVEQLKEGGKMIIPIGERYQQVFYLFQKRQEQLVQEKLIPTLFVPMTGISEEQRKIKPDPANPRIENGGFEIDENNDGRPDNWHYQRQTQLVEDDSQEGKRYLRFDNSDPGRLSQILQGLAVDGRKVRTLQVRLWVRYTSTEAGRQAFEKPALVIHFFDSLRRPIGEGVIGPWLGTREWRSVESQIRVPGKAREAIVRIGLNGATGQLGVDGILLTPGSR